ncbi:MAG: 2-phosphoglycolate phosphatase [Enterobacterales bacterium]
MDKEAYLMTNKFQSVLFDMDGTLLDSAPDMYAALELLCDFEQVQVPDYVAAQNRISNGVAGLFDLTFNIAPDHQQFNDKRDRYLDYYTEVLGQKSTLFPGINSCINFLNQTKMPWGIVTSKAHRFAHPLLNVTPSLLTTHCLIAGDTVTPGKPHPAPLFEACKRLDVDPSKSIYIGDAEKDITAGNSAGMQTIIADWGYIGAELNPAKWSGDYRVAKSEQLLDFLKSLLT